MKTEMMLLLMTDGRPVLRLSEVADLLSLGARTVQNKIYKKDLPFPMFKLEGSGDWVAYIPDVAAYIDAQRASALTCWNEARMR
ncbi:putative DNA-binding transcriptional regulator AlpA [Variovorax boronicumulans]|uniref:pyocin activator PrtN family protein n=1 Tax=Variovorax boronicumulans TaxID=436515 RepID=UPI0033914912